MAAHPLSRAAIFERRVGDCMAPAWPELGPQAEVFEAVQRMRDQRQSALLITEAGRVLGVLTEGDVSRRAAFRVEPDMPLAGLMSRPVEGLQADDYLFQAIAGMRRLGLRRMPVFDGAGGVVGSLELDDALAAAQPAELALIDRLGHDDSLEGLAQQRAAQPELAANLLAAAVPASDIQALLSHLNADLHRRVVARQLGVMAEQGWGPPPLAFDVIVMGSGGRGESSLSPDQDNALVIDNYPDAQHPVIDAWFTELAQRMSDDLNTIGIPYCRGHVMASNPLWRKSLQQWQAQLGGWLRRPHAVSLRLADIFFDFRPVYGRGHLAAALRDSITGRVRGAHRFLQEMLAVQEGHGVALSPFRHHLAAEREGGHRGQINLKYHGLIPLVESLRLLALRCGIAESGSLQRLAALQLAGELETGEEDELSAARELLASLLLRRQVADLRGGGEAGDWLPLAELTRGERKRLREALLAVEAFQARVRGLISGDVFT